jgi:4'-phosphopantetheinyl transferase EntD
MSGIKASGTIELHKIGEMLFGDRATLVIARIDDYRATLLEPELELIANSIDKRAREFSTGRHCAHLAMQQLGVEPEALLKGSRREPLWPHGIIGSISHCRDLAGAAVAKKSGMQSIGFDVENRKRLDPRIARHVCTPEESAWLAAQPSNIQQLALLLIFSVKEAVFKCAYQATGIALHFRQCEIVPDFAEGTATVRVDIDLSKLSLMDCRVRFWYSESHVFSAAALFVRDA